MTDISNLPQVPALSIRQPWAWMILNAGKDVENRTWSTRYRGPVLIHAGKGMTREEYWSAIDFALEFRGAMEVPSPDELSRGGIVGIADLVDCVTTSDSPWFVGPYGFVLRNVRPLPFAACKGALGFFRPAP